MNEPSRREKVLYYTLGITPPASSREWVERDVHSVGWRVRRGAQLWVGMLIGVGLVVWLTDGRAMPAALGAAIGGLIAAIIQGTVMAGSLRRRQLAYHRKRWDRGARQT